MSRVPVFGPGTGRYLLSITEVNFFSILSESGSRGKNQNWDSSLNSVPSPLSFLTLAVVNGGTGSGLRGKGFCLPVAVRQGFQDIFGCEECCWYSVIRGQRYY
jgi:hypothetical protein